MEVNIPEWLCMKGLEKYPTENVQANGNGLIIEFYFLFRIG